MRAAVAALALAGTLVLAGCGGKQAAERHDFNRYVQRVNGVENDAIRAWTSARFAYTQFGQGTPTAAQLRELDAVPKTIGALRGRIRAVVPPPPAKKLHADLLHLLDLDRRLAVELSQFGHYLHDVAAIERSLAARTKTLRAALTTTRARPEQERALGAYASSLRTVLASLGRLEPPPSLAPWNTAQLGRVRLLRRAALGVRAGLVANDRAAVTRDLGELQQAVSTAPVTVAERDAIAGYNARLARIRTLMDAISREQDAIAKGLS
jgi:hypothetical protein